MANLILRAMYRSQERRREEASLPVSPKSILCIELTRLGDAAVSLPLLRSVREAYPDAHLAVAVQAQYAGFFKYLPFIDTVYPLEKTRSATGMLHAIRMIRSRPFDLVVSISPARRNALLALMARAPWKAGYLAPAQSLTPFLDSSTVSAIGLKINPVDPFTQENIQRRPEKICRALGIPVRTEIAWVIPRAVKDAIRLTVLQGSQAVGSRLVVMHPFAGWRYREWEMHKYLSLASDLCADNTVIISGTPEELRRAGLPGQAPRGVLTFDASVLEDYIALLAQAQLFIGSDSGPLHLAASLGIPCIGLFGPATPALTGPESPLMTGIYKPVECSPCRQETCLLPDRPCMSLIGIEEVRAAAWGVLRSEPALSR